MGAQIFTAGKFAVDHAEERARVLSIAFHAVMAAQTCVGQTQAGVTPLHAKARSFDHLIRKIMQIHPSLSAACTEILFVGDVDGLHALDFMPPTTEVRQ